MVIGLHTAPVAGIVCMPAGRVAKLTQGKLAEPIAVSIVVAGCYEDDKDDGGVLEYTGE